MELKRQLGLPTAIFIVIADVIGGGIFVTTGDVLKSTENTLAVLVLWAVGGLIAITGCLCYAELATMWPDDGGEYIYLKKIFGMLPSFLTGWISLVIGFSAAAAMSALLCVMYLQFLLHGPLDNIWVQRSIAAGIVLFFSAMHIFGVRKGGFLQNGLTFLKLLIVFGLIAGGFYVLSPDTAGRLTADISEGRVKNIFEYGAGLVLIMYAFSGWNSATYIAGEIKNPEKNLPRALFFGTLIITVIYLLMNAVFLMSTDPAKLKGVFTVGALCAENLFGKSFSPVFTLSIAIIFLSSVSVQVMIGPRVYYAMAKDRVIFKSLGRINPRFQTPDLAILIQMVLTLIYVFVGLDNLGSLLTYLGFSLGLFPLLVVIGYVIHRFKNPGAPRPFKTPLFPLVPVIFILLTCFMLVTSLVIKTRPSLIAIGVLAGGVLIYYIWHALVGKKVKEGGAG